MSVTRVTIKDVARSAGVSIATVSNVLNGTGRVSADTVRTVRRAILELKFSPSQAARNLKDKKSRLIAVIVPLLHKGFLHDNPFYWQLVGGIEEGARAHRLHIMLVGADPEESYSFVKERHLDGLIVIGAFEGSEALERIVQWGVPSVFVDSYLADPNVCQILSDDEKGGYLGTNHLIDLGHRNIALLTGEIEPNGVHEARFLGYRRALKEAGIGYRPAWAVEEPPTMEGGARSVPRILALQGVSAVFATSDVAAMGLLSGLSERGLSVPRDLSVAGFDDLPYSRFTTPPLTTVAQDIGLKGMEAVRLLQAHMDNKEPPYRKKLIPVELKARQSTRFLAEGEG